MAETRFIREFDAWASSYDLTVQREPDVFQHYDTILQAVVDAVGGQPGDVVVDLGAGTGNLTALLEAAGYKAIGVEPSAGMRQIFRRKHPHVPLLEGDFEQLPTLPPGIRAVVSSYAFHHVAPRLRRGVLTRLARLLGAEGRLVLADVMFAGPSARRWVLRELEQLGRQDLAENLRAEYYPLLDPVVAALMQQGWTTSCRQLTEWVWLVCGQKRRGAFSVGDERVPRPIAGLAE